MHFKMASAKWHPFCLGLNVLSAGTSTDIMVVKLVSCKYLLISVLIAALSKYVRDIAGNKLKTGLN